MDIKLKQEILNHYQSEYYKKALSEEKGITRKILRLRDRARKHDYQGGFVSLIIASSLILGAVVGSLTGLAPLGIAVFGASFLAQGLTIVLTDNKIFKKLSVRMNKDLDNNKLVTRYKNEVLDKEIDSVNKREQKEMKNLKSRFNSLRSNVTSKLEQITSNSPKLKI